MQNFYITFEAVAKMLLYAAPAFLLMKCKKFTERSIGALVTVLLYICQPCLTVYSFQKATQLVADGTVPLRDMLRQGGIALLLSIFLQGATLAVAYLLLRRKQQEAQYRIFVIAVTFSNCGFFGLPILEAVMGQTHPEVPMISALFSFVMNMLCWTVVSAIITRDAKYISLKKVFLNPNTVGAFFGIGLLCLSYVLPAGNIGGMVTLIGTFSTPLCMFILGMRLALVKARELLLDGRQYAVVLCKNLVTPLLCFGLLMLLPIPGYIRQALFILSACPAANMVLSFSELLGQGQKTAANTVLLSTILCLVTLPTLCLLLPYLA